MAQPSHIGLRNKYNTPDAASRPYTEDEIGYLFTELGLLAQKSRTGVNIVYRIVYEETIAPGKYHPTQITFARTASDEPNSRGPRPVGPFRGTSFSFVFKCDDRNRQSDLKWALSELPSYPQLSRETFAVQAEASATIGFAALSTGYRYSTLELQTYGSRYIGSQRRDGIFWAAQRVPAPKRLNYNVQVRPPKDVSGFLPSFLSGFYLATEDVWLHFEKHSLVDVGYTETVKSRNPGIVLDWRGAENRDYLKLAVSEPEFGLIHQDHSNTQQKSYHVKANLTRRWLPRPGGVGGKEVLYMTCLRKCCKAPFQRCELRT